MEYPIKKWALLAADDRVLYVKYFSLDSPESYIGQYEGVTAAASVPEEINVEVGMYRNPETEVFEFIN